MGFFARGNAKRRILVLLLHFDLENEEVGYDRPQLKGGI